MKSNLKKAIILILTLSLLLCIAACGSGSSLGSENSSDTSEKNSDSTSNLSGGETVSSKDTLTMVSAYTDPGNFNPWTQATAQSAQVQARILEPMIKGHTNGTYVPHLAESFEWTDETTFVLHMREEDVYFHNGDVMTTDDILFSYELCRNAASHAAAWKMVDEIVATDEKTIEIRLSYPDIDMYQAVAQAYITSKAYYEEVGEQAFGTHPIGTGYFEWESYTSGDNVTLRAFDKYWGDHGTINTFIMRFISETSQALIELENGNVDIITADGSTVASAEGNENIKIVKYSGNLNEYLGCNFNSEKVQNGKVRQALAYIIDREAIVTGAREGLADISTAVIPTFSSMYNEKTADYYKTDPEKAKELLGELGYSTDNPLELTLLTDTSTARTLEAQQIKNAADAIGFKINIATFESATVTSILAGGDPDDYDIFIRAIGQAPSATYQLGTIFSVGATEAGNNPSWFTLDANEKMEEYNNIYTQAKQETDETKRAELLAQMQLLEREIVLANWILFPQTVYAVNANLRGYGEMSSQFLPELMYFVEE